MEQAVLERGARDFDVLGELEARAKKQYVPATSIATIYSGLGDTEQAVAWLQRAYEQRDVRMSFLKVDRRWDALRTDARFAAIAKAMDLR